MPPATITRSPPSAAATGQDVPYGPRTPTCCPGRSAHSAVVTWPTSRIVCRTSVFVLGSPLIEMGTSPMPGRYSMLNWPGRNSKGSGGVRSRVTTSADSRRTAATRHGAGSIQGARTARAADCAAGCGAGCAAPGSGWPGSAILRMAVHVKQLEPGGLQPTGHQAGESLHELIAKTRIGIALAAQARPVHLDGEHPLDGPPVELPAVRLEQPGEPDHITGTERLHDKRAAAGRGDLQGDLAVADEKKRLRRIAFPEQEGIGGEDRVGGASGEQGQVLGIQPGEKLMAAQQRLKGLRQLRRPPP